LPPRAQGLAVVALREGRHDRNVRDRNLFHLDAAAREHRRHLRRRDEEAVRRRLNPEGVRIEIGQDDSEGESVAASSSIRREDLTWKKVRRQDRIGVEIAHEPTKSSELESIEQAHELGLERPLRRAIARIVEVAPEILRPVDHLEIVLHVSFSIDRLGEIEHIAMKDFRSRPERPGRSLQGHRRPRMPCSGRNREDEEPLHRRDCSTRRIAATSKPIATTAARALSFPMNRANRAPA